MQLSTKAYLICFISTQIFTAHGEPNPKTFLIETEDNDGEDIKVQIEDNENGPNENEDGTDYQDLGTGSAKAITEAVNVILSIPGLDPAIQAALKQLLSGYGKESESATGCAQENTVLKGNISIHMPINSWEVCGRICQKWPKCEGWNLQKVGRLEGR